MQNLIINLTELIISTCFIVVVFMFKDMLSKTQKTIVSIFALYLFLLSLEPGFIATFMLVITSIFLSLFALLSVVKVLIAYAKTPEIFEHQFKEIFTVIGAVKTINEKQKHKKTAFKLGTGKLEKIGAIELLNLPFDKWFVTPQDIGVKFKRVHVDNGNDLNFKSEVSPGCKYGLQVHPGLKEVGLVVKGHLICDKTRTVVLEGEKFTFNSDQAHEPYANIYSEYDVTFYPNRLTKIKIFFYKLYCFILD